MVNLKIDENYYDGYVMLNQYNINNFSDYMFYFNLLKSKNKTCELNLTINDFLSEVIDDIPHKYQILFFDKIIKGFCVITSVNSDSGQTEFICYNVPEIIENNY